MNKSTLELTLAIKANEAALRHIQNTLCGTNSDCPPLTDVLTVIIEQTLIAAGVTGDFDIELHRGHITPHYHRTGGLSVDEWLETSEMPDHSTSSQDFQKSTS